MLLVLVVRVGSQPTCCANRMLAASVGFEPTGGSSPPPVFKTGAISQTLPTRHIAGLSRLSIEVKLNEKWYW